MKTTYRKRLFLYFFLVFATFTLFVVLYQQRREQLYARHTMEQRLDVYAHLAENEDFMGFLPQNLRVTIINNGGHVRYDNNVDSLRQLENHFSRPEIIQAQKKNTGSDIRESESLGVPFLYYAIKTSEGFVRVALPYDESTQYQLRSDKSFLVFALSLFGLSLFFLWWIANRFGMDMERMKQEIINQQEAKENMKSQMTSAIAHELRTPVSAIRGFTETLMEPDLPDDKREQFIERTNMASIRLSELLRDISLLTKIEESENSFTSESIDLLPLVMEVTEEFERSIHDNSIKLEIDIPENLKIIGNRTLIHSIFRNLIENSIRYAGRWIILKVNYLGQEGNLYQFEVVDSGTGVKAQDLDHIFERFYRGQHSGRSREDGSSGLGLSIVRHAVLHHGGDIKAENVSTGGLRVIFTLRKESSETPK